ncbi:MAG: RNA pseudouridine synthase [Neptuniibacter caesariensis]|uniref:Dual-specificity RNA pseudouridine synthase RluA n=1 Tax=Neptuniibacter caesariensis TaxID=207954 RepID=A0A2G6JLJ6_NEPCE|nr:MAG: RNA pseudouridine synthase [Neptuniibacter caesariensis]
MIEILYSDEHIVVANKPADMLSVPGKGKDKQDCLWRRVQQQFPTARIVHRLDYATSGIIILALTLESQRALSRSFQERLTHKRYQAIISGSPKADKGSVELPLRCDWENRPLQIVDHDQGKHALTHWERIATEPLGTRVRLIPVTGRSHQLRVHMQALGHPIIGDRFYAHEEDIKASERLLLHAEYLSLPQAVSGEELEFYCPCPF